MCNFLYAKLNLLKDTIFMFMRKLDTTFTTFGQSSLYTSYLPQIREEFTYDTPRRKLCAVIYVTAYM